jgi:hypothetical protein
MKMYVQGPSEEMSCMVGDEVLHRIAIRSVLSAHGFLYGRRWIVITRSCCLDGPLTSTLPGRN